MGKRYVHGAIALFVFLWEQILSSQADTSREMFKKGVNDLKTGDLQKAADLFAELTMTEPKNAKFHIIPKNCKR